MFSRLPGLNPGPTCPLVAVEPVPKARGNFRGLQKCFNFNLILKSEEKNDYNNKEYILMNPAWIIFLFTPTLF